jgi:HEAT repeat protein
LNIATLSAALESSEWRNRLDAVCFFLEAHEDNQAEYRVAIPLLVDQIEKEDSSVMKTLLGEVLGEIGNADIIPYLKPMIADDENWQVRQTAIEALGKLGNDKTLPFLVTLMQDSDPAIVSSAVIAIAKITKKILKS